MSLPSLFQYGLLFEGEMIANFQAMTDLGDEYFVVMWDYPEPTDHSSPHFLLFTHVLRL